jgi:hypothetical protein
VSSRGTCCALSSPPTAFHEVPFGTRRVIYLRAHVRCHVWWRITSLCSFLPINLVQRSGRVDFHKIIPKTRRSRFFTGQENTALGSRTYYACQLAKPSSNFCKHFRNNSRIYRDYFAQDSCIVTTQYLLSPRSTESHRDALRAQYRRCVIIRTKIETDGAKSRTELVLGSPT